MISRDAFFLENFEVGQGGVVAGAYCVILANETRDGAIGPFGP